VTWKVLGGLLAALVVLALIESQSQRAADIYVLVLVLGFIVANQARLTEFANEFAAELTK
jgi:uncharacterized membrane protein YdcZ (DUF606 family)